MTVTKTELDNAIDALRTELQTWGQAEFKAYDTTIRTHIDQRINDVVNTALGPIKTQLADLEKRTTTAEGDLGTVKTDITNLKTTTAPGLTWREKLATILSLGMVRPNKP